MRTTVSLTDAPSRLSRLRAIDRPLAILLADTFTMALGFYMLVPLLAFHLLENIGLTVGVVGLLAAVRSASQQGTMPWSGALADRLGHRRAIATGVLVRACGFGLFAFVDSVPGLVLASVLAGLGGSLFHPASYAAYALLAGERTRVTVYSLREILSNLGFVIGPLIGGLLAGFDFRWVCLVSAAFFATAFVITVLGLPADMRGGSAPTTGNRTLRAALHDRAFLRFSVLAAGTWVLVSQLYLAVPVQARRVLPDSVGIGAVYSLAAVIMVVTMMPITRAANRWWTPSTTLAVATLGLGGGLVLIGTLPGLAGLAAGVVTFTLGQMLFQPMMNAVVSEYASETSVASYFGVNGLSLAVGGVIGSAGGGFLYSLADSGSTVLRLTPWLAFGLWALVIASLHQRRGS